MKFAQSVIEHPITTEKAVKLMESENRLTFIVEKSATKQQIKYAMESLFKVKVRKVNTLIMPSGKKKAYIKLAAETPALDVATQLGLM
jgi:large subunit ribosomal protein L23